MDLSTTLQPRETLPANERDVEVSVVMPCLNEARTVGRCIDKARAACERLGLSAEVVVADNGSTDGSPDVARLHGARVVPVNRTGYGHALRGGIDAAQGEYIIMGDADDSYDFSQLDPFVERLRAGDDLVLGNRFRGGIRPGAMPWLHRCVGNPVLTGILNLFFHTPVGDAHCGLRACRKESYRRLRLVTTGMEFASEMVVKAALQRQHVSEVPVILYPDGRGGPPHLRSFRDGWRHLRFLLLMSPRWLYLFPALFLLSSGLTLAAWLAPGPRAGVGMGFDLQVLLLACLLLVLGYQTLWLWAFAGLYGWSLGHVPGTRPPIGWFRHLSLERGIALGSVTLLAGVALFACTSLPGFGPDPGPPALPVTMRCALGGATLILCGMQTVYGSFFLSALHLTSAAET